MSRTQILLGGSPFPIAQKPPRDARQFSSIQRPWQPGDPADKETAMWHPDGPQLLSYEEVSEGAPAGRLGVAWADGCDSRWTNVLCLGPLITGITLTGADITFPATFLDSGGLGARLDVNTGLDASPNGSSSIPGFGGGVTAIVLTPGPGGAYFLYFVRGDYVTKVNAVTLAVLETKTFSASATDAIATQTPLGTREVSVALYGAAYQVANPIGATTDTWTANTGGEVSTIFGLSNDGRVVAQAVNGGQVRVRGNLLTTVQTMLAPAWARVTEIIGTELSPRGFITEGYRWFMSTSKGPYPFDPQLSQPYALIPEMDNNTETGIAGFWSFLGAIFGSRYGVRWQKGGTGRSFGVETFDTNRTPVQGYPTALESSTRWHYQAVYNATTDTTWLVAFQEDNHEWRPNHRVSPFVIGKFAGNVKSRAMRWVGTANQTRTTQILVFGMGTNAGYIIVGETPQELDDSNYRYAATGTAYMTELRRSPHLIKDIEAIEFETVGCAAGRTITVGAVVSGDAAGATTISLAGTTAGVNDAITTNGYQRRLFVDNNGVPLTTASGRRFYPTFAFATNDSTTSPQIVGPIRGYFTLRPILIEEITIFLELRDDDKRGTAYDRLASLKALMNSGPVLLADDWFGDSSYVRIASVSEDPEVSDDGAGPDSAKRGHVFISRVVMHRWNTSGSGVLS